MDEERLNQTAEEMYLLFPLFKNKLFRHKKRLKQKSLPHSYFHVLKVLKSRGPLPMSEIGRRVCISKSNMTSLIDRLVENGLAERMPDKNDRRVINIAITKKGNNIIKEWHVHSSQDIKNRLSSLSDEDLETFYESIKNIRAILNKMDDS
ncbi:MAG: MarR family transcriptional regulator [Methanobacterium sp.]|nr:MarR family transcriptional regulator [Methanobacterium sp.]